MFTAGFRLVKPVLVCYSAVQKFRKEKNYLHMDAALSTPESEEGDVATKGKSTIFETFLNSDPLMRLQNNPIDVDYAITKVTISGGTQRLFIGKSDPGTNRSSMDDLLNDLLPNLRSIDRMSMTIYKNFSPKLKTIQNFLKGLKDRKFVLKERLKLVFVWHAAPLKRTSNKEFKKVKELVDLRTFAFEESAWQQLQTILGINYRMPDPFPSRDPPEIRDAFIYSGLFLDPPVRVDDVFAIAYVYTNETKKIIITKNLSLMYHAEEHLFHQLRKYFTAEDNPVPLPNLKVLINLAPCDQCCDVIISFLEEMRQKGIFFNTVQIVFACLYKFTEEADNPHVLGLKQLKASGVLLKTFDRNEWQHLGRVLRMADDWTEDQSLPWGARDERDETLKRLLQTILSASEL